MVAVFKAYGRLLEHVAHLPLGELPTPVERLEALERVLEVGTLHVKRDDLSGTPYGGNKVRKLEFLLGQAVQDDAKTVLTFGAAGSNHALATAIYARKAGIRAISMLVPQPNARSIGRNLLLGHAHGAELHHYLGRHRVALGTLYQFQRLRRAEGRFPMVIPPGGSSPVGCLGFVNAAFELREQIRAGRLVEPDFLYVASGTMGTCIGLLLGLRAAGLRTRVQAVRVTDPPYSSEEKGRKLYEATSALLHAADPAFPNYPFPDGQFELRSEFLGEKYGVYSQEGIEAIALAREHADLRLEGTYTGKALAALVSDARAGRLRGKRVLFWNTYNSRDFSDEICDVDYHTLPAEFHRYFEEPVQPLDTV